MHPTSWSCWSVVCCEILSALTSACRSIHHTRLIYRANPLAMPVRKHRIPGHPFHHLCKAWLILPSRVQISNACKNWIIVYSADSPLTPNDQIFCSPLVFGGCFRNKLLASKQTDVCLVKTHLCNNTNIFVMSCFKNRDRLFIDWLATFLLFLSYHRQEMLWIT